MTNANTRPDERLDVKRILPIFLIVLVDLLGLTIIIPLMPLYAAAFGADAVTIGLLGAAYPLMQFIGAPLLGRLSDRFGRKPVLVVSQIGTLIGFLILGFANTLWALFLARIIDGLSGANISTAQAVITDTTNEKTRTQGLGLLGAAFGIGFVIGPILAFVALQVSGGNFQVPAFLAAAASAVSLIMTIVWLPESLSAEQRGAAAGRSAFSLASLWAALQHPAVGILLVLMFAQQVAFGGFEQLLSLFTLTRLGFDASANTLIFVFVGVIVVAVQGGLIGQWSRRFGDRRLVFGGLALLALGLTLTAVTPEQPLPGYSQAGLQATLAFRGGSAGHSPVQAISQMPVPLPPDGQTGWLGLAWILIAMVPASIGGGILQPAINSMITKRVEAHETGGMLGISAALLSGANAVAPLIGGLLFQLTGSTGPFLAGGLLMLTLFLIAVRSILPGREAQAAAGLARGGAH